MNPTAEVKSSLGPRGNTKHRGSSDNVVRCSAVSSGPSCTRPRSRPPWLHQERAWLSFASPTYTETSFQHLERLLPKVHYLHYPVPWLTPLSSVCPHVPPPTELFLTCGQLPQVTLTDTCSYQSNKTNDNTGTVCIFSFTTYLTVPFDLFSKYLQSLIYD